MLGTNHVLENSQKLPPRVFQPLGASTLAHGWVRTVRTAQNLHNTDIQWAERDVEADFVQPKWCIPGRLNQDCGQGASIRIVCDGPRTSTGSPRRFDDNAPATDTPRHAPSDAAAERALLFAPAVRRRLVGPHAWSRARVDRLAPREEPKPSGEGSPLPHTCTARRRRPFSSPKSWDVGVRGVLWPHADFCAYNFPRGRERAPSIHATAPHDEPPCFVSKQNSLVICRQ